MKKTPIFLALACSAALLGPARFAPAQTAQTLTLDRALKISIRKNPSLSASRSQVEVYQGRLTQAKSAYLPQISGSAGYQRTYKDTDQTSLKYDTWENGYSVGANLSQYLYDFGKTRGKVEQSGHNLTSAKEGLGDVSTNLVQEVKTAFFNVLEARHLLDVSLEYLDSQQRHLAQAKALYNQGMRPKIDVTTGETEVSRAKLASLRSRYTLQRARIGLEKLLGGRPFSGPYALAEVPPLPDPPPAVEPLIDQAVKARPSLKQAQASVMAAQAGVTSVQGSYWPSLKASGFYGHSDSEFPLDASGYLGVGLSWEFFTGFRRSGEMSEAQAEVSRLKAVLANLKLAVTEEVSRAYLTLREAKEAILTAEVGVRQAKENLDMARGRYQEGESNAIEFNDAQLSYSEAKSALVQATYEYYRAWASLEYATGGDLSALKKAKTQSKLTTASARE